MKAFYYKTNTWDIIFGDAKLISITPGGETPTEESLLLPEETLAGELIVEGGYPNKLPIGVPEGIKCSLQFDTQAFTEKMKPFAEWLTQADSNKRITIRNGAVIDYIGTMELINKEQHSLQKRTFSTNFISLHKKALESVKVGVVKLANGEYAKKDVIIDENFIRGSEDLLNPTMPTVLDYMWVEGEKVNKYERKFKKLKIRFIPLSEWFDYHFRIVQEYFNKAKSSYYFGIIPLFFSSHNATGEKYEPINDAGTIDNTSNLYLIDRIVDYENKAIAGFTTYCRRKYENMWNFYIAYCEGLAKRATFTYTLDGLWIEEKMIADNWGTSVLPVDELVGSSNEEVLEISRNAYRQINVRIVRGKNKELTAVRNEVAGGSLSKSTYEATCLLGTHGAQADHKKYEAIYDAESVNFADTVLYEKINISGGNDLYKKVSDYCEYGGIATDNDGMVSAFLNGGTWENYVEKLREAQGKSLCGLTAKIIEEVIGTTQIWLTVTLPLEYGNINNLGRQYELDVKSLLPENHFYETINFKNKAILVYFKANYTKNNAECTFFIRSDQWA